jgi:predicted N-formylglutamate amidohydrolase
MNDRAAKALHGGKLLTSADPPAVEIRNAEGKAPVLATCDHASNKVPHVLGSLGLSEKELRRHIGWDIGAAGVTRLLAHRLGAPAILAGYSRLVVDCNRDPADATSMPAVSDGVAVPGNASLTEATRQQRLEALFRPYHHAIEQALDRFAERAVHPAVLSIHSFTPTMNGIARPWHIGVLWDRDPRIPVPLLAALRREPELVVGDNEPYSAREPAGYTVRTHAVKRGLSHVAVEIRQDLIAEPEGEREWAERLAAALTPILEDPALYHVKHY